MKSMMIVSLIALILGIITVATGIVALKRTILFKHTKNKLGLMGLWGLFSTLLSPWFILGNIIDNKEKYERYSRILDDISKYKLNRADVAEELAECEPTYTLMVVGSILLLLGIVLLITYFTVKKTNKIDFSTGMKAWGTFGTILGTILLIFGIVLNDNNRKLARTLGWYGIYPGNIYIFIGVLFLVIGVLMLLARYIKKKQ